MKTIILILILPAELLAQAVFSEVLYNEPETRVSLEWVEIYNRADTTVNLNNFFFISGNDTTLFPSEAIIPPRKYAILAKKLTSNDGTDSFEGHWGDSSGYWGDSPLENYRAYSAKMSLSNISGVVKLIQTDNGSTEQISWNTPAADGQSLERDNVDPPSETWHLSSDPSGSTPGRFNSEYIPHLATELLHLSSRLISRGRGEYLTIDYAVPTGSQVTIEIFDDSGHKQMVLAEKSSSSGQIVWDGRSGDGSNLPRGIYLLALFLSGNQNDSKYYPVVLAP